MKEKNIGKLVKPFAAFILCFVFVFGFSSQLLKIPQAKAISQTEVDKLKNQLSNITSQKKELEKEIKALEKEHSSMASQIELLDKQIAAAEEEMEVQLQLIATLSQLVAIKEGELEASRQRLSEQYDLMRERVRFMAEHGNRSYLSILLSSGSFSDFLTRFEVVRSIVTHDNAIFENYQKSCDEVEQQKISLEKTYAEAEAQEQRLEQNKAAMEKQMSEREATMAELVKKEAQTQKEYNSIASEEDKLINEIRDAVNQLAKEQSTVYVGGKFQWPLPAANNIVTSVYGMRTHPITGVYKLHTGVDLRASSGTPIYAANAGTVITATYSTAYGNYVVIDHGGGVATLYAHMTKRLVKVGDKVQRGKQIGTVGSTGYSTAPHLHYEIIKDGDYVDPVKQYPGFRIVHKNGEVLSR